MGIKNLWPFLAEEVPHAFIPLSKTWNTSWASILARQAHKNRNNRPSPLALRLQETNAKVTSENAVNHINHILVDVNNLLHRSAMKVKEGNEYNLVKDLMRRLNRIMNGSHNFMPLTSVELILDGPPAFSKMAEQRKRRILEHLKRTKRSDQWDVYKDLSKHDQHKMMEDAKLEGSILPKAPTFNSIVFVPGTSLMSRIDGYLCYFAMMAIKKLGWLDHVGVAGTRVAGEGESKIVETIKRLALEDNRNEASYAIVTDDSDLIAHALSALHTINCSVVSLGRDEVFSTDKFTEYLRQRAPLADRRHMKRDLALLALISSGDDHIPAPMPPKWIASVRNIGGRNSKTLSSSSPAEVAAGAQDDAIIPPNENSKVDDDISTVAAATEAASPETETTESEVVAGGNNLDSKIRSWETMSRKHGGLKYAWEAYFQHISNASKGLVKVKEGEKISINNHLVNFAKHTINHKVLHALLIDIYNMHQTPQLGWRNAVGKEVPATVDTFAQELLKDEEDVNKEEYEQVRRYLRSLAWSIGSMMEGCVDYRFFVRSEFQGLTLHAICKYLPKLVEEDPHVLSWHPDHMKFRDALPPGLVAASVLPKEVLESAGVEIVEPWIANVAAPLFQEHLERQVKNGVEDETMAFYKALEEFEKDMRQRNLIPPASRQSDLSSAIKFIRAYKTDMKLINPRTTEEDDLLARVDLPLRIPTSIKSIPSEKEAPWTTRGMETIYDWSVTNLWMLAYIPVVRKRRADRLDAAVNTPGQFAHSQEFKEATNRVLNNPRLRAWIRWRPEDQLRIKREKGAHKGVST